MGTILDVFAQRDHLEAYAFWLAWDENSDQTKRVITTALNFQKADSQGCLFYDESRKIVTFSFRGTSNIQNVKNNLSYFPSSKQSSEIIESVIQNNQETIQKIKEFVNTFLETKDSDINNIKELTEDGFELIEIKNDSTNEVKFKNPIQEEIVSVIIKQTTNQTNVINKIKNALINNADIKKLFGIVENEQSKQFHEGFAHEYKSLKEGINEAFGLIKNYQDKHGDSLKLICTGFSLGGAIATLLTHDIIQNKWFKIEDVALVTFGSPRVLCKESVEDIHKSKISYAIRVAIDTDNVPDLPKEGLYTHVGQLTAINTADFKRKPKEEKGEECGTTCKIIKTVKPISVATTGFITSISTVLSEVYYIVTRQQSRPFESHKRYDECVEYKELKGRVMLIDTLSNETSSFFGIGNAFSYFFDIITHPLSSFSGSVPKHDEMIESKK